MKYKVRVLTWIFFKSRITKTQKLLCPDGSHVALTIGVTITITITIGLTIDTFDSNKENDRAKPIVCLNEIECD